ncbi:Ral GTPase-activating protein subunit alpha/beta N-terminal domain-containing protein [Entamoeba marina]
MFTPTATSLGLLNPSPNTDVLITYDLKTQHGLVDLVCKQLFSNIDQIVDHCSSDSHCHWIMEVIGAGFRQDLTFSPLISQCIDLYEMWFLRKDKLPLCIKDNFLTYLEEIVFQLTLVFKHCPTQQQHRIYEMLCKRVVLMYQKLYSIIRDTDIEEKYCRVLIGVVEDVIQSENNNVMNDIIHLFYQVWTSLNLTDSNVLNILFKCHSNWVNNQPIASAWKETMKIIQTKVLSLMESQNIEHTFELYHNSIAVSATFDSSSLLKFWLKFMHLCGNICNVSNPEVHLSLVQGIAELVNLLLPTSLNGNDIMQLYGDILFQIIKYNNHRFFEESICQSLATLTKIFNQKYPITQFSNLYMSQLYQALSLCFTSQSFQVINFAIMEYYILIDIIPPYNTVFIADVITSIESLIDKPVINTMAIRPVSLQLLQKIQFILTNQRQKIKTTLSKTLMEQPLICSVFSICFDMLKIDSDNIDDVFTTLTRLVIDSYHSSSSSLIDPKSITSKFLFFFSNHYNSWLSKSNDKCQNCSLLNFMYILINYPKQFPPSTLKDIFLILHDYLFTNAENFCSLNKLIGLYSSYFGYCYFELNQRELLNSCLLMENITKDIKDDTILDEFRFDCDLIHGLYGSYLPKSIHKYDDVNEEVLKQEFAKQKLDFSKYIHVFYLFQKIVLSFIELPWEGDKVVVIMRTKYGKSVFKMSYLVFETNWTLFREQEQYVQHQTTDIPITKCQWINGLYMDIDTLVNNHNNAMILNAKDMNNDKLSPPSIVDRSSQSNLLQNTFNHCFITKILSSVLGYSHPHNSKVEQLTICDELFIKLSEMDTIPTYTQFNVNIKASTLTQEYINFVQKLGVIEKLEKNSGDVSNEMYHKTSSAVINYQADALQNISLPAKALVTWGDVNEVDTNSYELIINIYPTETEMFLIQSNCSCGPLLKQQLCSYETLPNFLTLSFLSYINSYLPTRHSFKTRGESLLNIGSFIETEYSSIIASTLLNDSFMRQAEPVSFKSNSVFDFSRNTNPQSSEPFQKTQTSPLFPQSQLTTTPQTQTKSQIPSSSPPQRKGFGKFKRLSGKQLPIQVKKIPKTIQIQSPILQFKIPKKIDRNAGLASSPQNKSPAVPSSSNPLSRASPITSSPIDQSPQCLSPNVEQQKTNTGLSPLSTHSQINDTNSSVTRRTISSASEYNTVVSKSTIGSTDDGQHLPRSVETSTSHSGSSSPSPSKRGRFIGRRTTTSRSGGK